MGTVKKAETGPWDAWIHQLEEHPLAVYSWCIAVLAAFLLGVAIPG